MDQLCGKKTQLLWGAVLLVRPENERRHVSERMKPLLSNLPQQLRSMME